MPLIGKAESKIVYMNLKKENKARETGRKPERVRPLTGLRARTKKEEEESQPNKDKM